MNAHDDDLQPPAKRTKTRLACQPCRDRKVRCDGARPICGSCSRKGLALGDCIYLDAQTEGKTPYVRSLENRVKELEQRLVSSTSPPVSLGEPIYSQQGRLPAPSTIDSSSTSRGDTSDTVPGVTIDDARDHLVEDPRHLTNSHFEINDAIHVVDAGSVATAPSLQGPRSPSSQRNFSNFSGQRQNSSPIAPQHQRPRRPPSRLSTHHLQAQTPCTENNPMAVEEDSGESSDALEGGTMGASGLISTESGGSVFLGRSSVAAFIGEVQQSSMDPRGPGSGMRGLDSSSTASRASRRASKRERREVSALMDELALPPRRVANAYLESYWENWYPRYPIIHKPMFMKRYVL